ncbi:hypothetical protein FPQ18DRAFT_309210 [Pyronema domesticum]|nr:hypothetical protein FPQ18DRAFT_309210 [Pyronema domesticum]
MGIEFHLAHTYPLTGITKNEMIVKVKNSTLGEEHRYTINAMVNLTWAYDDNGGRLDEVLETREKVLRLRKHLLGENRPDTIFTMSNLACTYGEIGGRLEEVREMEEKVLEFRKHSLGEHHPHTVVAMRNLAITYYEIGGRLEDTCESIGGRLEEVQKLWEMVLKASTYTLGEEHPKILESMHRLAVLYDEVLGKPDLAKFLEVNCSEIRKRYLEKTTLIRLIPSTYTS